MPIVDFVQLQQHAVRQGYRLPLFDIANPASARGVLEAATARDAPAVLVAAGEDDMDSLLPSVELTARRAAIPTALLAEVADGPHAAEAIRYGCNALMLPTGIDAATRADIQRLAGDCGIPLIEEDGQSQQRLALEEVVLTAVNAGVTSWRQLEARISQAVADRVQTQLEGARGQGLAALAECSIWHPVEHLIIYNTTTNDDESQALAAKGRQVLDQIPGVRATWSGKAIKAGAGYRWCWLVRFAHPAVIDSYREHPDHVAYADNHFRPIAGDRVSIDYELFGVEECE